MALARFQRTLTDASGNVVDGATVTVRVQETNSLASLFSDRAGTEALSNPLTTGSDGLIAFHAAGTAYKITSVKGADTTEWTFVGVGTAQEADFDAFTDYVDDEVDGLAAEVAAAKTIPQNAQTGAYTLLIGDVGKHVSITTGGVTVPSAIFAAGDLITIYNNSGSAQTITQGGSVTLRLAGTATTGNRTLAQRGICTVLCVASNEFVISGAGLT
jgi:hypothetical protein